MSKKGGSHKNKRIALPKSRQLLRKKFIWAFKPKPGPHHKDGVMALGEIIRDKLELAANRKEVKTILNSGKVLVDEKVRKDVQFPVGVLDIVRVEGEETKRYRVIFDNKGRLQLVEIPKSEKNLKVCKVTRKSVRSKGQFQLTTHDGRTFMEKTGKTRVGDSLVIELPSQKIVETIPLKEGQTGYLLKGTHVGVTGKIGPISKGTMQKEALVEIEAGTESFQTLAKNVLIVGSHKPAISLGVKE